MNDICPFKVAKHSYGDSDCHILIVLSELPLTIFEFGNMARAFLFTFFLSGLNN